MGWVCGMFWEVVEVKGEVERDYSFEVMSLVILMEVFLVRDVERNCYVCWGLFGKILICL